MWAFGRLGAVFGIAVLFLVSGCGTQQQAPRYEQAFGTIDSPCGGAVSDVLQHCTAHLLVVNRGGAGVGHVTLLIELKDAKAGAVSPPLTIRCGRSVPETPAGGYADLVCNFDLPPGKTTTAYPTVESVDYVAASSGGSAGFDFTGTSTLVLAVAVVLLCAALLIAGRGRQAPPTRDTAPAQAPMRDLPASPRPSPVPQVVAGTSGPDYDIPPLPR